MKAKDTIIGEYYHIKQDTIEWIIQITDQKGSVHNDGKDEERVKANHISYIGNKNQDLMLDSSIYIGNQNRQVRPATAIERRWLEESIKAGKVVDRANLPLQVGDWVKINLPGDWGTHWGHHNGDVGVVRYISPPGRHFECHVFVEGRESLSAVRPCVSYGVREWLTLIDAPGEVHYAKPPDEWDFSSLEEDFSCLNDL